MDPRRIKALAVTYDVAAAAAEKVNGSSQEEADLQKRLLGAKNCNMSASEIWRAERTDFSYTLFALSFVVFSGCDCGQGRDSPIFKNYS
jgi:hypothetical protein